MKDIAAAAGALVAEMAGDRAPLAWRTDAKGVATGWCVLADPADLAPLAEGLAALPARLSAITAFGADKAKKTPGFRVAYHFDLDGDTLTVTVPVPDGGSVASLTPWFANADWPEREMAELYGIAIDGHPDPRRLFVDEQLGAAVFDQYIPFSAMVNAATTKGLWEQVIARGKERAKE